MGASPRIDIVFLLSFCTGARGGVIINHITTTGAGETDPPAEFSNENDSHSHLETVAHSRPFFYVFSKNGCGGSPNLC